MANLAHKPQQTVLTENLNTLCVCRRLIISGASTASLVRQLLLDKLKL